MKIEPTELLKYVSRYGTEEYEDGKRIAVLAYSLGTTTTICEINNPFITVEEKREIAQRILNGLTKTEIKKFDVCDRCHAVGIVDTQCICADGKFTTIELEFEVCACCGEVMEDGYIADTEFNTKQLTKKKENDKN